jgi:hypothetical protein
MVEFETFPIFVLFPFVTVEVGFFVDRVSAICAREVFNVADNVEGIFGDEEFVSHGEYVKAFSPKVKKKVNLFFTLWWKKKGDLAWFLKSNRRKSLVFNELRRGGGGGPA